MNGHDPLCPELWRWDDGQPCMFCALVARVRADVLANEPSCVCKFGRGYAAALRDAVETVKALETGHAVSGHLTVYQSEAVAAIEALGGER